MGGQSAERSRQPLTGRRIVITRPRAQALAWMETLRTLGAEPLLCPSVEIVPPATWQPVDAALTALAQFDWILFTSANSIRFVCARLTDLGEGFDALAQVRIAAVGPQTAQLLQQSGVHVDLVPEVYQAEGLLDALCSRPLAHTRFLFPRAAVTRDVLASGLRAAGADVTEVVVYQTRQPETEAAALRCHLHRGEIAMVTFTSSSSVHNLQTMLGPEDWQCLHAAVTVACMGPVTAETARLAGLTVEVMPRDATIPALTDAIVAYYTATK